MPSPESAIGPDAQQPSITNDAFISYSRKDEQFARRLEKSLKTYKPPKDLNLPQRYLSVFRDKEDFTGVEYHQSLAKHLKGSAKMILICSPNACKSTYVNDEIRHFIELHGAENIIPILLSGIPNNEAKPGQEEETCFPQALTDALEMPLAVDYKGFRPDKDKVNKGVHYGAWYTLLANLYGISRTEIEQRDKKRRRRNRIILGGIATSFVAALLVAFIVTLHERNIAEEQRKEAVRQEGIAKTRQKEAEDAHAAEQEQRKNAEASAKDAREQRDEAGRQRDEASRQRDEVTRQRNTAEERGAVALSRQLAAQSDESFNSFPVRSLLLAVESINSTWKKYRYPTPAAEQALRDVLSQTGGVVIGSLESPVFPVAFSPDGTRLASGGADSTVRVWNLKEPKAETVVLRGHEVSVLSVAFSPDGARLASGGADSTVRVWNLKEPKAEPVVLGGHEGRVDSVAFSPDGARLASGSGDKTVRVWNLQDPKEPVVLRGHEDLVYSVAFSPDGTRLASGSEDKTVRVWKMVIKELVNSACAIAGRNLSSYEWRQYFGDEPYRQTCPGLPSAPDSK